MVLRRHIDRVVADLEPRIGAFDFDRGVIGHLMLAITLIALGVAALGCARYGHHFGFNTLNALGAPLPDAWLERLTYLGDSLFAALLLLLVARRHPELVWLALLATLIAILISRGCKPLVDAARPAGVLPPDSFRLIGPVYYRTGFPSGHTTTAFVTAGVFCCLLRQVWSRAVLLLLALAVGWSRIAVGAHWPLDVLGGIAAGCFSVWLSLRLLDYWRLHLRPQGFLLLVLSLVLAAAAALFLPPPYPAARLQLVLLALGALAVAVYDFLILPLQRRPPEELASDP